MGRIVRPYEKVPFPSATLFRKDCHITLGAVAVIDCAATTCDEAQSLAMLIKRDEETLVELMQRLDRAIEERQDNARMIDESGAKR